MGKYKKYIKTGGVREPRGGKQESTIRSLNKGK